MDSPAESYRRGRRGPPVATARTRSGGRGSATPCSPRRGGRGRCGRGCGPSPPPPPADASPAACSGTAWTARQTIQKSPAIGIFRTNIIQMKAQVKRVGWYPGLLAANRLPGREVGGPVFGPDEQVLGGRDLDLALVLEDLARLLLVRRDLDSAEAGVLVLGVHEQRPLLGRRRARSARRPAAGELGAQHLRRDRVEDDVVGERLGRRLGRLVAHVDDLRK